MPQQKRVTSKTLLQQGFALVEVLVTVAIVVILASIAVVGFSGQTTKAKSAVAVQDASAWASEITSLTSTITKFGATGTNTITLGTVTNGQATLTVNPGTGYTTMTPTITTFTTTVSVSKGTTLNTNSTVEPNGTRWCISVSNGTETAIFTQAGQQTGKTGCLNGLPT